ncbi:stabilin-2-like isoform X3 [Dendronephthya gigantea]|uniref:stabilin-2-like isoform X3 n=1 Tax=Dendronephthya gigantea TaxID=151771 RepID=UPI00106D29E7|nr:stabilin-2-like isoform X3 [Dendronephthya gigantea]
MNLFHLSYYFLVLCFCSAKVLANNSAGQNSNQLTNKCSKTSFQVFATPSCILCPLNAFLGLCPFGTQKITVGMGLRKCVLAGNLYGCVHLCRRTIVKSVFCQNYWGPDCRPCPGLGSGYASCFGNGNCSDLEAGNGTCQCNTGFEGFACEQCSNKTKFGTKCEQDCTCKHGKCDSGTLGYGKCIPFTCTTAYYGDNCDQYEPACDNCHNHSHCYNKICKCNPGYTGNGTVCQEIDPCKDLSNGHCQVNNSVCMKTVPGFHKCVCRQGYTGDGVICSAIDPCQMNNQTCPSNSRCNYVGPGMYNCSCLPGYGNYSAIRGCSLINRCIPDKDCLSLNTECVMTAPEVKECRCKTGYIGNGSMCYGNLLQRIDDLHGSGQNDTLVTFRHVRNIIKYHSDLTFAFAQRGPFTIFLPTDAGIESKLNSSQLSYIIKDKDVVNHLILAHSAFVVLPISSVNDTGDFATLKGWNAIVNASNVNASNDNNTEKYFFGLSGHPERPPIVQRNVPAWNGIIHVINGTAWIPDLTNMAKSKLKTFWQIITERPELQTFRSLVQAADMESELKTTNGRTLIVPVNGSFLKLNKTDIAFLKSSKGKSKLQAIIRHHIFDSKIGIIDMISNDKFSIMSSALERITVNTTDKGAVLLGGKSKLIDNDIPSANGFLHLTDTVLIPSFVLPLVKRYCNQNPSKIVYSPCRPCNLIYANGNCPNGTVKMGKKERCHYTLNILIGKVTSVGCRSKCKKEVKHCCSGFYGTDCLPCPGPIGHPCFGNGKCSDSVQGNGLCKCKANFKGTACELCNNIEKFGLDCEKNCECFHGTCHNGRLGNGLCVPNTCKQNYTGDNCDMSLQPCKGHGSLTKRCHVHAQCYLNNSRAICKCDAGFEKLGESCLKIDPCLKAGRGGCHKNANCNMIGPGQSTCTCLPGWTGDGIYCIPINYCTLQSHCHRNAKCTSLGPAKVSCECNIGYEGDGTSCREINNCLKNNGNCSPLARCIKTGAGQNKCKCNVGYAGDGYTCLASLSEVVKRQKELTIVSSLIVKYNFVRYLAIGVNLTVFLPSNAAFSNMDADKRKLLDIPANLRYFGGSNISPSLYMSTDLKDKNISMIRSWLPNVNITINHTKYGEPLIGGIARITKANITASNGILHIVDKVNLPTILKKPQAKPNVYKGLCDKNTEFSNFCHYIQQFKLVEWINKRCDICTIFVKKKSSFPHSKNTSVLFHMTNHYLWPSHVMDGQLFQSLAGEFYVLSLEKSGKKKKIKVNGLEATYYNSSSTWIIYTIEEDLRPVLNTCYRNNDTVVKSKCRPCHFSITRCRPGFRHAGKEDCLYTAFGLHFIGCRSLCVLPGKVRQCCPGFWGKECRACPGKNGVSCSGRGVCNETSNGHCECNGHFAGLACERCNGQYYGANCNKKCDCANGSRCDGKNGFCYCPRSKKGLRCDQKALYEKCGNNGPYVKCAQHASCQYNRTEKATCKCDHGFSGNGTECRSDLCRGNSDCSPNAQCEYDGRNISCSCKKGFTGDGYYCSKVMNTSCDKCDSNNADCLFISSRMICRCKPGYSGNGEKGKCVLINPCHKDNGGCSFHAICTFDEKKFDTRCNCTEGYFGDGKICVGNVLERLQNDQNLTEFYSRIKKSSIKEILSPENHVSLIAPHNNAFSSSKRKRRSVKTLSDSDLKYYIISCVALSESDANTTDTSFVTVAGSRLNITSPMILNGKTKVLSVKNVGESTILVVDSLFDVPTTKPSVRNMALKSAATSRGYGKFVELLTRADMLDVVANPYQEPYTMFWPSDDAFSRLENDLKRQLSNKEYARNIINYHIIQKTKITTHDILGYSGGLYRRTREGSSLFISCKGHQGDLYINDRSKIVERDIEFQEGVAFGVSQVLLPPGVAGRCDEIKYVSIEGYCKACGDQGMCPPGSTLQSVDKNSSCTMVQGKDTHTGCRTHCLKRNMTRNCCKNFYGADCFACPGGSNPCSGHGTCDEGISGSGSCSCDRSFNGSNCEICVQTKASVDCHATIISKDCRSRRNPCSIFATCDEKGEKMCRCIDGYEGDGYYCQEIDKCQTKNGGCNKHAICKYTGPNTAQCECRSGYVGNGYTCTPHSRSHICWIFQHICSIYATCSETGTSGTDVCRCRKGFVGNGISCSGSAKEVIYDTEDLSEFAKGIKKLGVKGNNITRYLSSEKDFTVFAPINYGFTLKFLKGD